MSSQDTDFNTSSNLNANNDMKKSSVVGLDYTPDTRIIYLVSEDGKSFPVKRVAVSLSKMISTAIEEGNCLSIYFFFIFFNTKYICFFESYNVYMFFFQIFIRKSR